MHPILAARLLRVHRLVLILALALLPGTTHAANAVDEFTQALRQMPNTENARQIKTHQKLLEQKAAALVRPSDLRRALLLADLTGRVHLGQDADDEDNPLAKTYRKVWGELTERLKELLRRGLRAKDAERRLAAVIFLSIMADDENKQDGEAWVERVRNAAYRPRFTPGMADDLRKMLAEEKEAVLSAAAAAAVVAIDPMAKATLDALKPLLAPKRQAAERRAAAEGLRRILDELADDPSALDRVGSDVMSAAGTALGDEDAAVRRSCLEAIRRAAQAAGWGPSVHPLPRSLARAVNAQTKEVVGRLDDADLAVRLSALQTLETIASARRYRREEDATILDAILTAPPKLAKSLAEEEVRVRLASLYVLETLGDGAAPAAEAVAKALKEDKNGFVRWGAARVLNNMAPQASEKAVPALADALADDNQTVRLTALSALRRYGAKATAAVAPLAKAVGDAEPRMRVGAIQALQAIGKAAPQSAVLIRALKKDKTPAVRAAAAIALGQLERPSAGVTEALRDALRDADADVRRAAGDALVDASPR